MDTAKIFKTSPLAKMPFKATPESVAYDIYSIEDGTLSPGETKFFSTGLVIQPPPGYYIKVCARSGWGKNFGVGIPHGMGIIDPDYCGPTDVIGVVLHRALTNSSPLGNSVKDNDFSLKISKGDRIAQIIFEKVNTVGFIEVPEAPKKESRNGFGSSGVK